MLYRYGHERRRGREGLGAEAETKTARGRKRSSTGGVLLRAPSHSFSCFLLRVLSHCLALYLNLHQHSKQESFMCAALGTYAGQLHLGNGSENCFKWLHIGSGNGRRAKSLRTIHVASVLVLVLSSCGCCQKALAETSKTAEGLKVRAAPLVPCAT